MEKVLAAAALDPVNIARAMQAAVAAPDAKKGTRATTGAWGAAAAAGAAVAVAEVTAAAAAEVGLQTIQCGIAIVAGITNATGAQMGV